MPVRELTHPQLSPAAQDLRDRLIAEWRNPDSTAQQPVILEERDGAQHLIHVYVIWEDWADLMGVERSEIIMDACEQVYGMEGSDYVTVAMGLTQREADRLRIH